ncbi:MAG: aminotransferase class I/II-fold pyridoxal phosphate-dependent enzyme [Gammaproteobacteria bacterium]|nr:aminotransferase class I/II-fold pyridoxal phosphate-dependent enzyme [Gammaproteobacteria bacterium]
MNKKNLRLSTSMCNVNPFRVMMVMDRAAELEAAGKKVVHMEVGEPDFSSAFPIINAAKQALEEGRTQYTSASGISELRESISCHYADKYRLKVDPSRIFITPGASGGLILLANMLVSPNDGILTTDPAYPCVRNLIQMSSAEPQLIPVEMDQNFQPNVKQIQNHKRENTTGIWLASPNNPTGTIIERDRLIEIARWARDENLNFVVDEIYHGLKYVNDLPSVLEIDARAFVVSSFSKYFGMTGWRLGWIVVPEEYIPMANTLAQNLFISAPSIAQHAALACFTAEAEEIFEERRLEFARRKNFLSNELRNLGFKIPTSIQGALYIYADISNFSQNSELFCRDLLNQNQVAITPGADFGEYKAEKFVRFAFTTSMADIELGLERLKMAL